MLLFCWLPGQPGAGDDAGAGWDILLLVHAVLHGVLSPSQQSCGLYLVSLPRCFCRCLCPLWHFIQCVYCMCLCITCALCRVHLFITCTSSRVHLFITSALFLLFVVMKLHLCGLVILSWLLCLLCCGWKWNVYYSSIAKPYKIKMLASCGTICIDIAILIVHHSALEQMVIT